MLILLRTDAVTSRVRNMIQISYLKVELPYNDNFGDIALHIRKDTTLQL